MTLPNLVIAGSPRCGTTSLFAWLVNHPEVCGSSVKETWYLVDREERRFKPRSNIHEHGLAGYRSYFRQCDEGRAKIIVEATPGYLYQRTAYQVLSSLRPLPRVLFILRKPSDRVYSTYHWARNWALLDEDLTFAQYVDRLRDADVARRPNPPAIERSQYADHLKAWLACFPRASIEVLLFEKLRQNPRVFMRDVATRIGIDPSFYDGYSFPHRNSAYQPRRTALHRAAVRLLKRIAPDPEGRARRVLTQTVGTLYASINITPQAPVQTSDDRRVLDGLDRHFAPYNRSLAGEMQLDLSLWE